MVTIFRTGDPDAEDQAAEICDLLVEAGLTAVAFDDTEAGVVQGSWEVRVPPAQVADAEKLLDEIAPLEEGDSSDDMDLVPIFEEGTELSEMEAMSLKALLESNGIHVVMFGSASMPNLPFEIKVPAEQLEEAERIIQEAAALGAEGADAAEAAGPGGEAPAQSS